jgi:uncharacterized protein YbaR (Trm112 family)
LPFEPYQDFPDHAAALVHPRIRVSLKLTIDIWPSKIALMIPQDLLDILVCPVCKKPLVLKDEGQSLKCGHCHRVYPIRDDIPILLVDEAVTDPS